MLVDTSMYKINPITKIQNVVLKNLLDTRYRQRNKRKEKKELNLEIDLKDQDDKE